MNRWTGPGYCAIVLFLLIFLSGCGRAEPPFSTEEVPESVPLREQAASCDLLAVKWASERVETEGVPWSVADCLEVTLPDAAAADNIYYYSALEDSCYYILEDLVTEGEEKTEHALFWITVDPGGGESVMEEWSLRTDADAEGREEIDSLLKAYGEKQALMTGMDVSGGRIFLFFQQWDSERPGEIRYFRAQADRRGHIEGVLDLSSALREGKILSQDNVILPGGRCDKTGRCYMADSTMERIAVIDGEGRLLTVLEEPDNPGGAKALTYMGKTKEGNPLYACGDFQGQSLVILGCDGEGKKELYRGDYELMQSCLIRPDGSLLYGDNSSLFCWNVLSGTFERLYDGKNLNFFNCDGMLEGSDGKVYAAFRQEDGTFLYGFSDRAVENVVIRLEMLTWGNDYIETCAAEYTRRHPGVVIEITECQEDAQAQQSRVMAQISQGEGPELMLVRRPLLLAMQSAGALAGLSEVLPAQDREQIFPAALENGEVGGELYGITCGATFSTLLVSEQVWQDTTWSLGDVMGILKEREMAGHPAEQFSAVSFSDGSRQAYHMLYDLVLANIGQCPLLDLEAGKCCFDTEEFYHILEFCKQSGEATQGGTGLTGEEQVREQKALAYKAEGNLISVSRAFALLGEGYHAVGYPTDGESGNLLVAYEDCVAVNIHAGHRETVDDFLRFLTDYKSQRQYSTNWIRKDVLRDCVDECREIYGYPAPVPVFRKGDRSVTVLAGRADGTSWLEEFLQIAESGIPYAAELDVIRNIVQEEAEVCFAGDRSERETAEIIQRRVQLYLDETR